MSSLPESKVAELMFVKKCSKFCVVFVAFFFSETPDRKSSCKDVGGHLLLKG